MNGNPTMALDPSDLIPMPGTIVGVLGAAVTIVTGAFLWLRKYLSGDAVDRSANKAQTDVITMLNQQIANEQLRSERLQGALDESTKQIRDFQDQISELTRQVRSLQAQIATQAIAR